MILWFFLSNDSHSDIVGEGSASSKSFLELRAGMVLIDNDYYQVPSKIEKSLSYKNHF
ncbi:hypothetical protein [Chlamydia muridarum]|uniref:hypothetical protein n=1 Tax=Chlamydia muridarum TaxID=83560 RepID=UPI0001C3714A|nr:hypothetical protein [Chlamydia muridarum]AHH23120.1 hypothetical protein TAC_03865 [Chlamydia muridarum str. Nigg3 CMUT3-5]AHH24045.1 hypothetical protein Y015_03865 [Chlamydia muridarum str. Nigg CM972]KDU80089.1 hypothetical protein DU17_0808 [Chlamydia muridarum]KDU81755.1 hypothetical protein DU18_0807 [Chlamydia muridarum]KDU82939.1 hypothetical protein DU19_0806 [Chlamydia muridarum]